MDSVSETESQPPPNEDETQYDLVSNADTDSMAGSYLEVQLSHAQNETNDILRAFLNDRPKLSDFLPKKPDDDVQQFFDSMAAIVRKFSPLSIAKIKLKIGQIVGEAEIAWAERQEPIAKVLVQPEMNMEVEIKEEFIDPMENYSAKN